MTRLLLLRHAESEWNAQHRWQGMADPPLSARGQEQALQAGQLLRGLGISSVVSSDLRRARDTAERIAPTIGMLGAVDIEAGLREYDVGEWSGLTRVEIEARWPGGIEAWREGRLVATPGGERNEAFVARISAAIVGVAVARPDQTVLVITHGGVISAIVRSLGEPPQRFTHLAGAWIEHDADGLRAGPLVSLLARSVIDGGGEGTELAASTVMDTRGR